MSIIVLLQYEPPLVRGLFVMLVVMFALVLHERLHPYDSRRLNQLERTSLIASFLTLFFGLFFKIMQQQSDLGQVSEEKITHWNFALMVIVLGVNLV